VPPRTEIDARLLTKHIDAADGLPLERVYRWERERPNRLFLTQPLTGGVREWTWAQAMDEVRRMAAWLASQPWPGGSRIVILSKNCAYWMMSELAIWMAGHVSVPIYPSLTAASVRKLLEHCEPVACFVGGVEDKTVADDAIPTGVLRVRFPTAPDFEALTWDSIVADTAPMTVSPARAADELATIIYTSGTTGTPKGVMHRFAAFGYFVAAGVRVFGEGYDDRMLSYLPLAHIAERALVEACAFYLGFHVFFVQSVDTFRADLKRARPTIFFSVPRLFVKFQQGVLAKIPQQKLDLYLRMPVLGRLVQRRVLRELGLDQVRLAASGGAPLPVSTLIWFRSIGLNLVEGYGMTETGITHTPYNGRSHLGYVGDGAPGVETRIDDNGEVLVRSPMNMIGYYKDPEGTRAAFTEDGFFRTGDMGELDCDGWLRIIGRVKEQFKTSKGKYVSPTPIEKLLSAHPGIEACCVMGAGMPYPFALILLAQDMRESAATADGQRLVQQSLEALLNRVNTQLEAHERLSFLVVTPGPWTIANGLLTPTMKLKRNLLEAAYSKYVEEWKTANGLIIWHNPQ
jgi:long-chain acyl-CoA synthetase